MKRMMNELGLLKLGHEELPDIIAYSKQKNWIFLIEAVYTSNPIDNIRRERFSELVRNCSCGVIYVTAFLNRKDFRKYSDQIAWETEVWIAENPDHIIHFDGEKYLGPYNNLE